MERPNQAFLGAHFPGNQDEFDSVRGDQTVGEELLDGQWECWDKMMEIVSRNPTISAADYAELRQYLDLPAYCDYMLLMAYVANGDWPSKNWFSGARRGAPGAPPILKWLFFPWDTDLSSMSANPSTEKIGPFESVDVNGPGRIYNPLMANDDFRRQMGDRIQRQLFNGGGLSPEQAGASYQRLIDQVDPLMVARSARWGDWRNPTNPVTYDQWRNAVNSIRNNFFPNRRSVLVQKYRDAGRYPPIDAPTFAQPGGPVEGGFRVLLSAPEGAVYFTTEGSDPRLPDGSISPSASLYAGSNSLALACSTHVKTRVLSGAVWSALSVADFAVPFEHSALIVMEIMYHPTNAAEEFIELKNISDSTVALNDMTFTEGLGFTCPPGARLGAGELAVVAADPAAFAARYPGVAIAGLFAGELDNAGERIEMNDLAGQPLVNLKYNDGAPWPVAADGLGFSIVLRQTDGTLDANAPSSWRASAAPGGSPGSEDAAAAIPGALVNEALTHTDLPQRDAVELYNPGAEAADIGG